MPASDGFSTPYAHGLFGRLGALRQVHDPIPCWTEEREHRIVRGAEIAKAGRGKAIVDSPAQSIGWNVEECPKQKSFLGWVHQCAS